MDENEIWKLNVSLFEENQKLIEKLDSLEKNIIELNQFLSKEVDNKMEMVESNANLLRKIQEFERKVKILEEKKKSLRIIAQCEEKFEKILNKGKYYDSKPTNTPLSTSSNITKDPNRVCWH